MPTSKQPRYKPEVYALILREFATYCILILCLIVSFTTANREQYAIHQTAVELRRVQDYTDTQVLQSRVAMLDIVSGLSANTEMLAHITCLSSDLDCSDNSINNLSSYRLKYNKPANNKPATNQPANQPAQ